MVIAVPSKLLPVNVKLKSVLEFKHRVPKDVKVPAVSVGPEGVTRLTVLEEVPVPQLFTADTV